jgi:hypothetical protein
MVRGCCERTANQDERQPATSLTRSLAHRLWCFLAVSAAALTTSGASANLTSELEPLTPGSRSLYVLGDGNDPQNVEYHDVLGTPKDLNGTMVSVIRTTSGPNLGTEVYLTNNAQGLRIHGLLIPDSDGGIGGKDDLSVVYSQPILLLGPTFIPGSTFHSAVDAVDVGKVAVQFHIEHDTTVEGFATIHTGAGQLDTVKLHRKTTVSFPCTPGVDPVCPENQVREARVWLARGLGMVKTETCDNRPAPGRCENSFFTESDPTNTPDTQKIMVYTENKTYLPEPGAVIQHLFGAAGVAALGRWRARSRRRPGGHD